MPLICTLILNDFFSYKPVCHNIVYFSNICCRLHIDFCSVVFTKVVQDKAGCVVSHQIGIGALQKCPAGFCALIFPRNSVK